MNVKKLRNDKENRWKKKYLNRVGESERGGWFDIENHWREASPAVAWLLNNARPNETRGRRLSFYWFRGARRGSRRGFDVATPLCPPTAFNVDGQKPFISGKHTKNFIVQTSPQGRCITRYWCTCRFYNENFVTNLKWIASYRSRRVITYYLRFFFEFIYSVSCATWWNIRCFCFSSFVYILHAKLEFQVHIRRTI